MTLPGNRILMRIFMIAALASFAGCDNTTVDQTSDDTITIEDAGSTAPETVSDTVASPAPEFPIHMGDAENVCMTDSGRIFVTGSNIAEITSDGAVMLMPANYGIFGGIAQVGQRLYVICNKYRKSMKSIDMKNMLKAENLSTLLSLLTDAFMDKVILRADLGAGGPDKLVFTEVHHLTGMMLANGMAADSKGDLYVADMTFLPVGKIVKVSLSGDADAATAQETWLSRADGVHSPNGMCIRNDVLYFTDYNIFSSKSAMVKKVAILGDRAGTVKTIHSAAGLYDDLDSALYNGRDTIAVAGYFTGNILIIDEETGTVIKKAGGGSLQSPSSVHFGNGGWIDTDEFIVTEVGMLYEPYSNYGNRVNVIAIPEYGK